MPLSGQVQGLLIMGTVLAFQVMRLAMGVIISKSIVGRTDFPLSMPKGQCNVTCGAGSFIML